jgi:hypothetical protein
VAAAQKDTASIDSHVGAPIGLVERENHDCGPHRGRKVPAVINLQVFAFFHGGRWCESLHLLAFRRLKEVLQEGVVTPCNVATVAAN